MTAGTPFSTGAGVVLGEVAGHPVALNHGDPVREYEALRGGAMLVDRSMRHRYTFDGKAAAETLAGLVSNDVLALQPGEGQYAAALTPKGKIIADVRIFRDAEQILVDVPPRAAEGWQAMIRKFVNPRLARWQDATDTLRAIGVYGVESRAVVAELTSFSMAGLQAMPLFAHAMAEVGDTQVRVARVPELGLEGYELLGTEESLRELWKRALAEGATAAGLEAWEMARIEAGRPEWGLDIDESTMPQEANFDDLHAISYTKGCYTGQETVARIHFRGHVNRHLRGLRTTADETLPYGAQLVDDTGRAVGDVRSATISPRLGNIALAMVRRETVPGSSVDCRWEGGTAEVTVWPLPFPL